MTKEERVQHCMDLMREVKWYRGKSAPSLAAEWGISLDCVEQDSSEAWRRVKAEVMDPELVGPDICMNIAKVMRDAIAETDDPAMIDGGAGKDGERRVYQESPNVSRKVVLEAAKTYAAIVLAKPPEKLEVTGADGAPLVTPTDAARLVRELFGAGASKANAPVSLPDASNTDPPEGSAPTT